MSRIGGILYLKVDGVQRKAKGDFTYNLGVNKKEMKVGSDSVHGYTEIPQVPFIEGAITDEPDLDLKSFFNKKGILATLEVANGKVIQLKDAIYAGDGNVTTAEGEIAVRFEGMSAEEVTA